MLFIATLTHDPEDCWMRGENRQKARTWVAEMDERAADREVELRGAYIAPNEHTFIIVVEAHDLDEVTAFLGPPLLTDHEGDIRPVLELERTRLFED